jgi:hypothetical protein
MSHQHSKSCGCRKVLNDRYCKGCDFYMGPGVTDVYACQTSLDRANSNPLRPGTALTTGLGPTRVTECSIPISSNMAGVVTMKLAVHRRGLGASRHTSFASCLLTRLETTPILV